MPDANLTKKLYCDALLSLCESRKLSDVTVTALVAQAGTARQTFTTISMTSTISLGI